MIIPCRGRRFGATILVALTFAVLSVATPWWPCAAAAAQRHATPAAPRSHVDTLFADVAAQQASRLAHIAAFARRPLSPAALDTLIDAGRLDAAQDALARLQGDARDAARVRLRLALILQDYAAAGPLVATAASRRDAGDAERSLRFDWLFAHDDAATVEALTRTAAGARGATAPLAEQLAAGRLALALLQYDRAESCFVRVIARTELPADAGFAVSARAAALKGMAQVHGQRREYDRALDELRQSLALGATPDALSELAGTLIRLGRTDAAIAADEWAVRLNPYHEASHYLLGNGYARKTYTELFRAYPAAFADAAGRRALVAADERLRGGDRAGARAAYDSLARAHPGWADARVRLASLDVEDGRYADARDRCFQALRLCPAYGRAHATLAKALEFQRFDVDVHRAAYESRFAAAPTPRVPGIETFVLDWASLSRRDQKRVALSILPWKNYVPVLVEGGSRYYIKPLYMLLSEVPGLETLRDTRIDYDSRLWDDVRGAGGFTTVTGIEDVERTIFDRYNTVLHELTHQVHGVLTAAQDREIQELYRRAKARDERTKQGFLSRYAGGSVYEYFAEGANALGSPQRDRWDPREIVRPRLDAIDPALRELVRRSMARTDLSASYPIAYANAGDDRVEKGDVAGALTFYARALARAPKEERALESRTRALVLSGARDSAVAAARVGLRAHPESGSIAAGAADAWWYGGLGLDSAIVLLERVRAGVLPQERDRVDVRLGNLYWVRGGAGDAARAVAAYDSALVHQADLPEALWGEAAALALDRRWDKAFELYERAMRSRTGIAQLRCDYARDLIRAGRLGQAGRQLDEAALLDPEHPVAEALRGWLALERGRAAQARAHARRALGWGPWCDLARIVLGRAEQRLGHAAAAAAAVRPVHDRIIRDAAPEFVYRTSLSAWVSVHELPAVELAMMGSRRL